MRTTQIDVCGHDRHAFDLWNHQTRNQLSAVYAAADAGAPAMTPAQALAQLMAGNQRFQRDANGHPHLHAKRRSELAGGQSPFAVILSCSDSRVPPELIFDQGLGGLFVVRLAGNTVTRAGLEEYRLRESVTWAPI